HQRRGSTAGRAGLARRRQEEGEGGTVAPENQLSLRSAVVLLLAVGSCRHPRACRDLGGTWRAEADARFRYRVTDRGQTVTLEPLFDAGGAGTDYGKFRIVLARATDGSLRGAAETTYTQGGRSCALRFEQRIDHCTRDSLELWGEASFDIAPRTCAVSRTGAMTAATLRRER